MGLEVYGIYLDISKALDKVWHDGIIFKLHQNGICGEMINILGGFPSNRKKESFQMLRVRLGLIFTLVYHKDPFWDLCYI